MTIIDAIIGVPYEIVEIEDENLKRHLSDLGLIPKSSLIVTRKNNGVVIKMDKSAANLALSKEVAEKIVIRE